MTNKVEQNLPKDQQVVEVAEPSKQPVDSNIDSEESNGNESGKDFHFFKDLKDLKTGKNSSDLPPIFIYNDSRSGGSYFEDQVGSVGDVVGANQNKQVGDYRQDNPVRFRSGRLSRTAVEKISNVYIEPTYYVESKFILKQKRILILYGDNNFGKTATAIKLLTTYCTRDNISVVMDSSPKGLISLQIKPLQGYFASKSSGNFSSFDLNRIHEQLVLEDSYLVITVNTQVNVHKDDLCEYMVRCQNIPFAEDVFNKHILWYSRNNNNLNENDLIFRKELARELITKNTFSPCKIDELSKFVVTFDKTNDVFQEELKHFDSQITQERVSNLFKQHQELSQRVFIITLAILNGCEYQTVVKASQDLERDVKLLLPVSENKESDKESEFIPIFDKTRSQRIQEVGARLFDGYKESESRRIPIERVEFSSDEFSQAIILYTWKEYDLLRTTITKWLYKLGFHSDWEVRMRVAVIAGELSRHSFNVVCEDLLTPWAKHEQQYINILVAISLIVTIEDFAMQVLELLESWRSKSDRNLYWTSMISYYAYGIHFPDDALDKIYNIVAVKETEINKAGIDRRFLSISASQSISYLFQSGRYFNVLNSLKLWMTDADLDSKNLNHEDNNKKRSAYTPEKIEKKKFVKSFSIGTFIYKIIPMQIQAGSDKKIPTLLWLICEEEKQEDQAIESRQYINTVVCLLQQSLNERGYREVIFSEIHSWLKLIEKHNELYRIIGRILFRLVAQGNEKERCRIISKLEYWESMEKSKPASKILINIKRNIDLQKEI
jgi:uncharacterized protein (DUF2384 family)